MTRLKFILTISLLLSISFAHAKALPTGLHYRQLTTPFKQSIHILEVDPTQVNIIAAHAKETALGRETVTTIAQRYQAIAAINGGFFKGGETPDPQPARNQKIHNQWYGIAYRTRGAIGWSNQIPPVLMDRIQTKTNIYLNHQKFPVHTVNQPGLANKTILYTEAYGKIAGSAPGGLDVVIENNHIINIKPSGETPIHKGRSVYFIGAKAKHPNRPIEIGNIATINIEIIPQFLKEHYLTWQAVEHVVGGAPLLVYQGKLITDYTLEHLNAAFISERYARTAIGILKNGHWIFVAAEQSALSGSVGMTIPELAHFMQQLGCEYALNLDGGGSSTLYIDKTVVNHPEGEEDEDYRWQALRRVSDAILILPKTHPTRNKKT